eukprot:jgi/Mesen1/4416/ME000225S03398
MATLASCSMLSVACRGLWDAPGASKLKFSAFHKPVLAQTCSLRCMSLAAGCKGLKTENQAFGMRASSFFSSSSALMKRAGDVLPAGRLFHPSPIKCSVLEQDEDVEEKEEERYLQQEDTRVPVTVITGFLGSGKTTLLNHVLTADHGKRIAVIENEFGEVDVDGSLVASHSSGAEDILMLNNGCLCCTVRSDLVRMMSDLRAAPPGLANPAPIIQTFFLEDGLAEHVKLDGVVTLVDAKHVHQHIDEVKPDGIVNEAVEQIAFADRIILNKSDLVSGKEMDGLSRRIRRINGLAELRVAKYGSVDMDYVLGIGGFDLDRIEQEVERQTETASSASTHAHEHKHKHEHAHEHGHDHEKETCGGAEGAHAHDHGHEGHDHHDHDHTHDPSVSSISIVCDGELDLEKINDWLGDLLQEKSEDLYRMKGVLAIKDCNERFGVHELFEGVQDRPWGEGEKRTNKMVFIGKDLDKAAIRSGFESCIDRA